MATPFYALRVPEVFEALETSPNGLVDSDVEQRLSLYGLNELSEPPGPPFSFKFITHLVHPMALLLWVAGGLAFAAQRFSLGTVIWIVVLVNAGFSLWQEHRAEQAITALNKLLPPYARLLRNGVEAKVPASQVVPGDVLLLSEGDNVPADARIVEEYGLRVNNASLTGEALPARKTAEASLREGISELERPNLAFAGTSIVSGTGRAIVYATGMTTQFGRIASLTQTVQDPPSLLLQNLAQLTRLITYTSLGFGVFIFLFGSINVQMKTFEAFMLGIGIIVASVPEGLIPTVTLTLAMAVQRLAQRGVLVKKLALVETLGTVSVICTDKSGTLTQNQMTVREVWVAGHLLHVSGVGYEPRGSIRPSFQNTPFEGDVNILMQAAVLCNNSRLIPPSTDNPRWTSLGDQTEAALRVLAVKGGADDKLLIEIFPRVHEIPFDARRKRMSTIHRDVYGETAFVKGAPREVLQLCTQILWEGEVRPLEETIREEVLAANDNYARNALRVLALARRELPPRTGSYVAEEVEREMTFLGLVAMMDPPRSEVSEAIQIFQNAGVRAIMITGDYGLTAESVARRVGMLTTQNPLILTGAELDDMTDTQLQEILEREVIFARMAPDHKLRLVAAFQAMGDVVAVIGDGVNDAPALRKADIGIVMGLTGTDVAKEAGDVIITNDNFCSITDAIAEGRTVYANLRKFITYIFASNVPEILPFIARVMFNIPLALTVAQILAIDLGTDLLPALALGTEKPEPDVMQHPPRHRSQPLIDKALVMRALLWLGGIEAVLCFLGYFLVFRAHGYTDLSLFINANIDLQRYADNLQTHLGRVYILATTVFHAGVVFAQIGNAFACRTEVGKVRYLGYFKNKFLLAGIAIEAGLIMLLIYFKPLAWAFEHLAIPLAYWPWLVAFGPVLYFLDWLRRHFIHLRMQARANRPVIGKP
jgi:Ca2+-transporting ATPase